jgi:hypothetical protein
MAHQLLSRRFGIAHKRSPDAPLYLTKLLHKAGWGVGEVNGAAW